MSVGASARARKHGRVERPNRAPLRLAFLGGVALAGWLAVSTRAVAVGEARFNGWLLRALRVADTDTVGSAVTFPLDGRWVGYVVTTGCSVAVPLIGPVLLVTGMVAFERVTIRRAVAATGAAALLLVVVNQLRLALIAGSMKVWGYETGYERGHVLLGSTVATLALMAAALVFVVVLSSGHRPGEEPARG